MSLYPLLPSSPLPYARDGAPSSGGSATFKLLKDTWLYSEADGWTEWTPPDTVVSSSPPGPTGRRWHAMSSLDTPSGGHTVVMFGGAGGVAKSGGNPLHALDDTYVAASVALWTRLPPPRPPNLQTS